MRPQRDDPLFPKPSSPWQATPQQEYYTPQTKNVRKRYKTDRLIKWESHMNEKHGEPKKIKLFRDVYFNPKNTAAFKGRGKV